MFSIWSSNHNHIKSLSYSESNSNVKFMKFTSSVMSTGKILYGHMKKYDQYRVGGRLVPSLKIIFVF